MRNVIAELNYPKLEGYGMIEPRLPVCPICKQEFLLPFSISQFVSDVNLGSKTFGTWVCTNCGFYMTTADTRAINPIKDIKTGFNLNLRDKIKKWREEYKK